MKSHLATSLAYAQPLGLAHKLGVDSTWLLRSSQFQFARQILRFDDLFVRHLTRHEVAVPDG